MFTYPIFTISFICVLSFSSHLISPISLYPIPFIDATLSFGRTIFFAVCSFAVNVPVLSVAITLQLPKLSTAFSFFTITCLFAILFEDTDNTIVIAIVNPSGIAETVNAITVDNISDNLYPLKSKNIDTIIAKIKNAKLICFENFSIFITNGVFESSESNTFSATFPNSVY